MRAYAIRQRPGGRAATSEIKTLLLQELFAAGVLPDIAGAAREGRTAERPGARVLEPVFTVR